MRRKQVYYPIKTKNLRELHYISTTNLFISFLFFFQLSYSQLKNQEKESYLWFDEVLGAENVNLYNGLNYVEKYNTKNGNDKFFNSENTLIGSIVYEGQPYYNVKIKYDAFEDQVLVMSNNVIQLIREHVSSFTINENRFVYLETTSQDTRFIPGFYEILIETSSYSLYKKHQKKKIDRLGEKTIYFEFFDDNQYYVYYSGIYHKIKTKRDVLKVFPEFKKEIKEYSKKNARKLDLESYLLNTLPKINFMRSETANLKQ